MDAPDFLDPVARAKFEEMCKAREFRPHEVDQLASYCANFSRWREAEQWLSDPRVDGDGNPTRGPVAVILDDKQNVKSIIASPQIAIAEKAVKEMARIAKLLRLGRLQPRR